CRDARRRGQSSPSAANAVSAEIWRAYSATAAAGHSGLCAAHAGLARSPARNSDGSQTGGNDGVGDAEVLREGDSEIDGRRHSPVARRFSRGRAQTLAHGGVAGQSAGDGRGNGGTE